MNECYIVSDTMFPAVGLERCGRIHKITLKLYHAHKQPSPAWMLNLILRINTTQRSPMYLLNLIQRKCVWRCCGISSSQNSHTPVDIDISGRWSHLFWFMLWTSSGYLLLPWRRLYWRVPLVRGHPEPDLQVEKCLTSVANIEAPPTLFF